MPPHKRNQNLRLMIHVFLSDLSFQYLFSDGEPELPPPHRTPLILGRTGLWTCSAGTAQILNLALFLCVVSSTVHSCQHYSTFFHENSLFFFFFNIFHRQSLLSLACGFNLNLVRACGKYFDPLSWLLHLWSSIVVIFLPLHVDHP